MSKTRTLTIASMAAPGWIRINEVANTNMHAVTICGGIITIHRSRDGKVYTWDTNTDHIRIVIEMTGPTDLAFITHASNGVGWFKLDDFPQVPLRDNKLLIDGKESHDADLLEKIAFNALGDAEQTSLD